MVGVTDSFFSYRKRVRRRDIDFNVLMDVIAEEIAARLSEEIRASGVGRMPEDDTKDLKEILSEEVAKFDSIEEVRYLGDYLIDYWKKLHEK